MNTKKTQQTAQHTPGALRAACSILAVNHSRKCQGEDTMRSKELAQIIDRETAAPELLRVLKLLVNDAKHKGVEPVLIGMAEDEIFKAEGGK